VGDTEGDDSVTHVLCINQAMPRHPIATEAVALRVAARPGLRAHAVTRACIDEQHANPALAWQQMGSPEYLSAIQVATLKEAAEPVAEALPFEAADGAVTLRFQAAPQSVTLLRIEWERE